MITIYDRDGKPLVVHEVDAKEHLAGGFFFREPPELLRARQAAPLQKASAIGLGEEKAKSRARRSKKGKEAGSWL
jgi:hypothetical protein